MSYHSRMINKIVPGSVKRIAKKGSNFQLMENIAAYQKAVKKYGVPQEEIFQTADLFEKRNIKQVVMHIHALGRIVSIGVIVAYWRHAVHISWRLFFRT